MAKFSINSKIPVFGHFRSIFLLFEATNFFQKNLPDTQSLIWVLSTMPKRRKKLIMQFQEIARTHGRKEGRTDPTVEPVYNGHFWDH